MGSVVVSFADDEALVRRMLTLALAGFTRRLGANGLGPLRGAHGNEAC